MWQNMWQIGGNTDTVQMLLLMATLFVSLRLWSLHALLMHGLLLLVLLLHVLLPHVGSQLVPKAQVGQ